MTTSTINATPDALRVIEKFHETLSIDDEYDVIMGWYHCEGCTNYLLYDQSLQRWELKIDERDLGIEEPDEEMREIKERINSLFAYPPPPLPADLTIPARGASFVHEGWKFSLFYFPELRRWEIGPIGRR